MPKVKRGRLSGLNGMATHSAAALRAWADRFEEQSHDPLSLDDPRWLRRWAGKMRRLAAQKEKAAEHKDYQRSDPGSR